MPLVIKPQKAFFDLPSGEIFKQLSDACGEVILDKFRLAEFAFNRALNQILLLHPSWNNDGVLDGDALSRLVNESYHLDMEMEISTIIAEFIEYSKNLPVIDAIQETGHIEVQKTIFNQVTEQSKVDGIDDPVSVGGRTRLHIACEEGNLEEVRRLVENCGAKTDIRDNSNWTPKDRAIFNNSTKKHEEIIKYLDSFA
jgi:hypothetical protein